MLKRCSNCSFGEMHDYLNTYYCRNRNCSRHLYQDSDEVHNCNHWEPRSNKSGYCSDCKYSVATENEGYQCSCIDARNYYVGQIVTGQTLCDYWVSAETV